MGTWREKPQSRKLKDGPKSASQTDSWVGTGFTDSTQALAALKKAAPLIRSIGLKILGGAEYSVDPVSAPTDSACSVYNGSVTYKTADIQQQDSEPEEPADETLFTFDFSSMEGVRLHAYEQTTYLKGNTSPLINWTKAINQQHPELPPEGVGVNKPIANFTGKSVLPYTVVDHQFWKDQLDQIWTLNESKFLQFPAKCVALTGISGELRSSGYWHLEYAFEYRPMQEAETIESGAGKSIEVPELPGWVYVWAEYADIKTKNDNDPDNPEESRRVVKRVHAADIYRTSDFADLHITGV